MEFFKVTKIDFMKYRWISVAVSVAVVTVGMISYNLKGGFSYGVDFAGGALVQMKFKSPQDIGALRDRLDKIGFAGSRIQQLQGANEYIVRIEQARKDAASQSAEQLDTVVSRVVQGFQSDADREQVASGKLDLNSVVESKLTNFLEPAVAAGGSTAPSAVALARSIGKVRDGLGGLFQNTDALRTVPGMNDAIYSQIKDKLYVGDLGLRRKEIVGPQVGQELRGKARMATIWALIGMLVYIWFRFQFVYGVSTIITLTHDVFVTIGAISLFNIDFDLTVLAAVLTIVGYSVNDTIVIFDRIRDNLKLMKKASLSEICNTSINQTLSRTVLTSGTVFVTVLALYLFGGDVIHPFAFTMLIGVVSGTISTIYISCPLLLWWQQGADWKRARAVAKRKTA